MHAERTSGRVHTTCIMHINKYTLLTSDEGIPRPRRSALMVRIMKDRLRIMRNRCDCFSWAAITTNPGMLNLRFLCWGCPMQYNSSPPPADACACWGLHHLLAFFFAAA